MSLNPLHCGAVVASGAGAPRRQRRSAGLNPLHCGAVVASRGARRGLARTSASLNPLHCGAVVASGGARCRIAATDPCLNPLHCGAVVASSSSASARAAASFVSIPFIAGQWSLRIFGVHEWKYDIHWSQSPSLRGSGRFSQSEQIRKGIEATSQSPSLRGSGRFRPTATRGARTALRGVSIPFIAGQWSLPLPASRVPLPAVPSQSPSLRGSGRFSWSASDLRRANACLNPLHCGAVVASTSKDKKTESKK